MRNDCYESYIAGLDAARCLLRILLKNSRVTEEYQTIAKIEDELLKMIKIAKEDKSNN